jgi:hypothetical protein
MARLNDIIVCSWGYEQTNVDFYQVVGITSKSLKLRGVDKRITWKRCEATGQEDRTSGGFATPIHGQFTGDVFTRRFDVEDQSLKIGNRRYGCVWNGEPQNFTCYA